MIELKNITKRYKKQFALHDISTTFEKGQVVSLIGPNGSGKTTLIKLILGLVQPDSGSIYFQGQLIDQSVVYRKHIGYMPQIGRYPDNMKIGQLFNMVRSIRRDHPIVDNELYTGFGLESMADKTMRALSGGTRQKVSAALAFLFDPEVFILDEPTAGLDPLSSEVLKAKILQEKEKGKLVLITSHVLSDLEELTTDVMYLHEGNVLLHKPFSELQDITGEEKLSKVIAYLMKHNSAWQENARATVLTKK